MIQIVEALDQEVVCLVDVGVEARAGLEEAARDFALFRHLLLGKNVGWLFSLRSRPFWRRSILGWTFVGWTFPDGGVLGCDVHPQIVADETSLGSTSFCLLQPELTLSLARQDDGFKNPFPKPDDVAAFPLPGILPTPEASIRRIPWWSAT